MLLTVYEEEPIEMLGKFLSRKSVNEIRKVGEP